MKKELIIGIAILILGGSGITYFISQENTDAGYLSYACNETGEEEGMVCFKLSGRKHTWCYWNETDTNITRHSICKTGWYLKDIREFQGIVTRREIFISPEAKQRFDKANFTEYNATPLLCSNVSCNIVRLTNKKVKFNGLCIIKGTDETPVDELTRDLKACEEDRLNRYYESLEKKEEKLYPKTEMIKGGKRIIS